MHYGAEMATKLLIPRRELPDMTAQSLSNVDRAIACGDLETVVIGRKRFATLKAVEKWLAFLAAASDAGQPIRYMAADLSERRTPEVAQAERSKRRAPAAKRRA